MGGCASICATVPVQIGSQEILKNETVNVPRNTTMVDSENSIDSLADAPKRSASQLKIDTSFDLMNQGMPSTPLGDMARVYKFYCPLCCMYYQSLFKTSCCANYACKPCTLGFIKARLKLPEDLMDLPTAATPNFGSISCPHCATSGVSFAVVKRDETVRSYMESPATRALLERVRNGTTATVEQGSSRRQPAVSTPRSRRSAVKRSAMKSAAAPLSPVSEGEGVVLSDRALATFAGRLAASPRPHSANVLSSARRNSARSSVLALPASPSSSIANPFAGSGRLALLQSASPVARSSGALARHPNQIESPAGAQHVSQSLPIVHEMETPRSLAICLESKLSSVADDSAQEGQPKPASAFSFNVENKQSSSSSLAFPDHEHDVDSDAQRFVLLAGQAAHMSTIEEENSVDLSMATPDRRQHYAASAASSIKRSAVAAGSSDSVFTSPSMQAQAAALSENTSSPAANVDSASHQAPEQQLSTSIALNSSSSASFLDVCGAAAELAAASADDSFSVYLNASASECSEALQVQMSARGAKRLDDAQERLMMSVSAPVAPVASQ